MKGSVVVTGGSGFLGRKISAILRKKGYQVFQMAMPKEDLRGEDVFRGDITDPDSFSFPSTDVVIHCAGILESSHPTDEMMFNVNYKGTRNVYEEGKQAGMNKFIMISTISAIGPQGTRSQPMTEKTKCQPNDAYGRSKRKAEEYLLSRSKKDEVAVIILRPTVLYGEGMNLNSSGMKTFTSIKKGIMPVVGKGDTIFNLLYVDNFVDSIILSLEKAETSSIFNISEGSYTQSEVISIVEKEMGKKGHIRVPKIVLWSLAKIFGFIQIFSKKPPLVSMVKYHALTSDIWNTSSEKIRKDLGWKPRIDLKDGVKSTIDHYGLR